MLEFYLMVSRKVSVIEVQGRRKVILDNESVFWTRRTEGSKGKGMIFENRWPAWNSAPKKESWFSRGISYREAMFRTNVASLTTFEKVNKELFFVTVKACGHFIYCFDVKRLGMFILFYRVSLSNRWNRILPTNFEMKLFLHANACLWG